MKTAQELLIELASAIRSDRKARIEGWGSDMQATWMDSVDERLEALALLVCHDVQPSTYTDERDRQVNDTGLANIFRARGTY
jgi:hypothetical protein